MPKRQPNAHRANEIRALTRKLARYQVPNHVRSLFELLITAAPLAGLWILMLVAVQAGHWLGLLLALPAGGLLVRLFVIQHDCGHGSFFTNRHANNWLGRVLGVVTLTPYDVWRHDHALHHARQGNLQHRGIGDIGTLTVAEFMALSPWRRLRYRAYRHPLVMFGVGPAYLFLVRHRLPMNLRCGCWRQWTSALATNAATLILVAALVWRFGWGAFLLVQLPITLVAAAIGVWLFYVQHQFEDTLWEHDEDWSFHEAALHGSSHYDLPAPLRWLTANIGVHHLHHLSSRIPSYRIPEALRDHPELRSLRRLTLRQSLKVVRLVLWDEEKRRLVSFAEAGGTPRRGAAPPRLDGRFSSWTEAAPSA